MVSGKNWPSANRTGPISTDLYFQPFALRFKMTEGISEGIKCSFAGRNFLFAGSEEHGRAVGLHPRGGLERQSARLFSMRLIQRRDLHYTGYGDITPTGLTQFFAAAEAFIGSFSMSLFAVVFVREMIR